MHSRMLLTWPNTPAHPAIAHLPLILSASVNLQAQQKFSPLAHIMVSATATSTFRHPKQKSKTVGLLCKNICGGHGPYHFSLSGSEPSPCRRDTTRVIIQDRIHSR